MTSFRYQIRAGLKTSFFVGQSGNVVSHHLLALKSSQTQPKWLIQIGINPKAHLKAYTAKNLFDDSLVVETTTTQVFVEAQDPS